MHFRLVTLIILLFPALYARSYTISGYVTDRQSGEPILSASVSDTYSGQGTITNAYGFYTQTLPSDSVKLQFSYVGYAPVYESFMLRRDIVIYSENGEIRDESTSFVEWQQNMPEVTDGDIIGEMSEILASKDVRLLEDGVYNGKTVTAHISESYNIGGGYAGFPVDSVCFECLLFNLDQPLYLYSQTSYSYDYTKDFAGLFVEPVQIYCNISNGIGIFASQAVSTTHQIIWKK